MSLIDTILNAGGGAAVQQLGSQLGLGQDQTTSALTALIPALAAGMHQNAQRPDGLGALISAISSGQHQQYLDAPTTLGQAATIADGNKILGHVLGSKDVSRQVAAHAAAQTGVSADVLKQMLPLAATLVMGALAHRSSASPAGLPGQTSAADVIGMLGSTIGSAASSASASSTMVGMLGKFLGR